MDISKAQDVEAGDGTTTVVVIAGALLEAAGGLLEKSVHPSVIAEAFLHCQRQAKLILRQIAIPADLNDREALIRSAKTSLNSKVVSNTSHLLAPLAVDSVLRVIDVKTAVNVDLNAIRVVKKLGGTVEDTELVEGLVFDQSASHQAGGPTLIRKAKIGLIQYCLSAPKTQMDNQVVVNDYSQIDRVLRDERNYIKKLVKPIIKSGCNVLLIQKSILRDAFSDLSLSFLARKNVMVIPNVERQDIEFISQTLGCQPIADSQQFTAAKLGQADLVEEINTPDGPIVKVTGVKNPGRTVSLLVRGSNHMVLGEAERSVHDALCVVRSLVKERYMVVGGGAPEIHLSLQLEKLANEEGGMTGYCMKAFARALEIIPYTLAENAGLNAIQVVTELRAAHSRGEHTTGINVRKGRVAELSGDKVLQPLLVTSSAVSLAAECVRILMKIDDIVAVR